MLQRVESPETVLAFRAVGTIAASDDDAVVVPAVERMIVDRAGGPRWAAAPT